MKKFLLFFSLAVSTTGLISANNEVQELKQRRSALKQEIKTWKSYGIFCDTFFFLSMASGFVDKSSEKRVYAILTTATGALVWRAVVLMNQYQIDKINKRLTKIEA